ncbi:MAG: hypothetical protein IJU03_10490 [Thermoguttaceae bacterium]|nr:hypothetical protein [Thermoguttaceae bacterium]
MARKVALASTTAFIALLIFAIAWSGCKREGATGVAQTHLEEGGRALDAGDWSRARDAFTSAIETNDQLIEAFYGRAAATLAQAEEHYKLAQAAATMSDVDRGETEAQRADVLFDETKQDCDAALGLDPDFSEAYFIKGVVAQYQGAWNEGIEAFTECLRVDPNRAEAYHRRGEIYDHIGDYINSTVDFKKAGELGFVKKDDAQDSPQLDEDDLSDLKYDADENANNEE